MNTDKDKNITPDKDQDSELATLIKGSLITLAGAACWGGSGCVSQFIFSKKHIDVLWLMPWRLFYAGILLIAMGFMMSGKKNAEIFKKSKDVVHMLVFAIFGVMMSQTSYLLAINYSNAATATVLQSLAPVLILIILCVGKKRLPKLVEAVSIIMAVLGVYLIGTHGNIRELSLTPQGLGWGLMTAVAAMFYTTISGDLIRKYGTFQVLGYSMTAASFLEMVVLKPWTRPQVLDLEAILAIIVIIVIGSLVAYALYLKGVSMVGPLKGSLYGNMEPVAAIILSVVWLKEAFTLLDIIGFVLILVSAVMLAVRKN